MSSEGAPDFELAVEDGEGAHRRVAPAGELDLSTVPQVQAAMWPPDVDLEAVTLDLSGLTFMDTSGLRLVLEEDRRAKAEGRRLHLVPGPPTVHRVFELAGIADRLPFGASSPPTA